MEALLDAHILAVWATRFIEPRAAIHANRLRHKRGIVFPFTDRIAEPSRLRIPRKRPPVGPDLAPEVFVLIQDERLRLFVEDVRIPQFVQIDARHALRIAVDHGRVVYQRRRVLVDSIAGPISFHLFERRRSVGGLVLPVRRRVYGPGPPMPEPSISGVHVPEMSWRGTPTGAAEPFFACAFACAKVSGAVTIHIAATPAIHV